MTESAPPPNDVPPSAEAVRIAYFISSYGSGAQLLRLVSTLRRAEPESPIVIRHDVFQNKLDPDLFADVEQVYVLAGDEPITWGDMTLEAARWSVFRWILTHLDVDWVVLLSEQDYPIRPLSELRQQIVDSRADALIVGERVDHIADPELRREFELRYLYNYTSLPNIGLERRMPRPIQAALTTARHLAMTAVARTQKKVFFYAMDAMQLPTRIGIRQRKSPFSEAFPCWKNDCWCALSTKALAHVLSYIDEHPEFVRYYARTIIPLESATATIVFNDPELVVADIPTHTIRWSNPTSGRPDVFTSADLDFLMQSPTAFARKFNPTDTALLDTLDAVVLMDEQETR